MRTGGRDGRRVKKGEGGRKGWRKEGSKGGRREGV